MNIKFTPGVYVSNPRFNSFKQDVMASYNSVDTPEELAELVDDVIANPENKIGEGTSKVAYAIPGIEKFVVAQMKNTPRMSREIIGCDGILSKYNFGEPIATNGSDLVIMEKIEGVAHSIPEWIKSLDASLSGIKPTKQKSKEFLAQITKIEDFPVESYVDLAQKIKYLSDNGIRMDSINPNNLMIDSKNRQFNLIDQMDIKDKSIIKKYPINTTQDMISIVLDGLMHSSFLEQLDEVDKQKLITSSKKIIKKCRMAGKIAGLENDNTNLLTLYKKMGERRGKDAVKLYDGFVEIYKDSLFD